MTFFFQLCSNDLNGTIPTVVRKNLMVVGEEGSGKTTFMNSLIAKIRRRANDEKDKSYTLEGNDLDLQKHKGEKTLSIREMGRITVIFTDDGGRRTKQIFTFWDTPGYGGMGGPPGLSQIATERPNFGLPVTPQPSRPRYPRRNG